MKRKKYRAIAWILTAFLALFLIFAVWYKLTYSMDRVEPYSLNSQAYGDKLLIATQGSVFKDALVAEVTSHFQADSVFIRVVDVSALPKLDASAYKAIFVLHTWEYDKPPREVAEFVEKSGSTNKLVVVSTSGEGGNTIEGVDGIGGESIVDDIPDYSMRVIKKLEVFLDH